MGSSFPRAFRGMYSITTAYLSQARENMTR
uniref:Uncharacterized protein n=1 Tax=Rhizophora mucronata TaxID=61149 RepID=A0A2P2QHW9_RHIMU